MKNQPKFRSWGDAEADRLWQEMYKAEMELDDMDLATESPKLMKAMEITARFRTRMQLLEKIRKWR